MRSGATAHWRPRAAPPIFATCLPPGPGPSAGPPFLLGFYLASSGLITALGSFSSIAAVWLPTGVGAVGLLLFGWQYWPVVFLGTCLTRVWAGHDLLYVLPPAIGNSVEALVFAVGCRRAGLDLRLARFRDTLILLFSALLAAAFSASMGSLVRAVRQQAPEQLMQVWWQWWVMNVLGLLVVVPAVLGWRADPPWGWSLARVGGPRGRSPSWGWRPQSVSSCRIPSARGRCR